MRILAAGQDDVTRNRWKGQKRGGGRSAYRGSERGDRAGQQGGSPSARLARSARRTRALRQTKRTFGGHTEPARGTATGAQRGGFLGRRASRRDARRDRGALLPRVPGIRVSHRAQADHAATAPQPPAPRRGRDRDRCCRGCARPAVYWSLPLRGRQRAIEPGRDPQRRRLSDVEDRATPDHGCGRRRSAAHAAGPARRTPPIDSRADVAPDPASQRASARAHIRRSDHLGGCRDIPLGRQHIQPAHERQPVPGQTIVFLRRVRQSDRRIRRPRTRPITERLRSNR